MKKWNSEHIDETPKLVVFFENSAADGARDVIKVKNEMITTDEEAIVFASNKKFDAERTAEFEATLRFAEISTLDKVEYMGEHSKICDYIADKITTNIDKNGIVLQIKFKEF